MRLWVGMVLLNLLPVALDEKSSVFLFVNCENVPEDLDITLYSPYMNNVGPHWNHLIPKWKSVIKTSPTYLETPFHW